jgi:hypothetical protein
LFSGKVIIFIKNKKENEMKEGFFKSRSRTILVLAVFLSLSCSFLLAQGDPQIKFKENSWDFGNIKEGQVKTHEFVFENTGNVPLIINRVRTSCGCAAALVSDKKIEPGKTGEIKVTFDSRNYEGKVSKYVYVESNDKAHSVSQLVISATIEVPPRPRIDLERYNFDSGLILEGQPILAQSVIINRGEQELRVSFSHRDATYFHNGKEILSELKIPAGEEAEVEIKIPPRSRQGLIREYILLKSNDTRRPNLSLYISGYVITKKQLKDLFDKYKEIIGSE